MGHILDSSTDTAREARSSWAVWALTAGRAHVALPDHRTLCGDRLEGPLRLAGARARRCDACSAATVVEVDAPRQEWRQGFGWVAR